jgi:hypothetical protein
MARKPSLPKLYQRGISLADAASQFAPESLVKKRRYAVARWKAKVAAADLHLIATLRSPTASEALKAQLASQLKIDLRNPKNEPFCNRDPNKYLRTYRSDRLRPDDYDRWFEEELVNDIRDGKYFVLGIELPRSSKSKPARVPDDVLRSSFGVDWHESILAGNGLKFVAVRVVPLSCEHPTSGGASIGRGSRKSEIQRVYMELRKLGKIKPRDPPKSVENAIRKELIKSEEDDWGLHPRTISRHTMPLHRHKTK